MLARMNAVKLMQNLPTESTGCAASELIATDIGVATITVAAHRLKNVLFMSLLSGPLCEPLNQSLGLTAQLGVVPMVGGVVAWPNL